MGVWAELITIVTISVALAMDALAVSIVAGTSYRQLHVRHAIRMAVFFGVFQGVMPLIGWALSSVFSTKIAEFDHWVAFGLLSIVGVKMIVESFKLKSSEKGPSAANPASLSVVLALAIATSIDALAVGITLALITTYIVVAVTAIGVITFTLSLVGTEIGRRVGHFFENRIEIAGGIILIVIGGKILITHLWF